MPSIMLSANPYYHEITFHNSSNLPILLLSIATRFTVKLCNNLCNYTSYPEILNNIIMTKTPYIRPSIHYKLAVHDRQTPTTLHGLYNSMYFSLVRFSISSTSNFLGGLAAQALIPFCLISSPIKTCNRLNPDKPFHQKMKFVTIWTGRVVWLSRIRISIIHVWSCSSL